MSSCSSIPAHDQAAHDAYCPVNGGTGCDWPGRQQDSSGPEQNTQPAGKFNRAERRNLAREQRRRGRGWTK